MATPKRLRAVQPGDEPAPKKRSRRDLLEAMAARIEKTVFSADCPPRDLASLTRRLADISKEIEQIDARAKQEDIEDGVISDEEWNEEAL